MSYMYIALFYFYTIGKKICIIYDAKVKNIFNV
jgi:hypothetical protein